MAPEVYEQARAEASIHAQIWRPKIGSRNACGGLLRIEGRIVRVFRDRQRALRFGQRVSFWVPIMASTKSDPPELSGEIRHAWESIAPARFVEAFMEWWDDEFVLVRSQIAAIRRPTYAPICDAAQKGFLCQGNL